ncbi:uncharacterized protein PGTG_14631 [Puccinia graminis f. sp. tritici CRL 75-36-700-3]|uniref:Chitinase n=1 Tax=Puccinia graminis f. sp. tritici (strain CRL 75-36-700-3 / race SCCL) TaxID=418459 RepID=E3KWJ8_PUCGT|nr:uncharacterized protein PGTG_14631 [Puccinia graminis f. sp. tritici CRL 75-36-700-3]EFP88665.2 hypothetical protein PGTG_14631 [Puccinia graminis f. sp. tritici CRL 75-36-700-3]
MKNLDGVLLGSEEIGGPTSISPCLNFKFKLRAQGSHYGQLGVAAARSVTRTFQVKLESSRYVSSSDNSIYETTDQKRTTTQSKEASQKPASATQTVDLNVSNLTQTVNPNVSNLTQMVDPNLTTTTGQNNTSGLLHKASSTIGSGDLDSHPGNQIQFTGLFKWGIVQLELSKNEGRLTGINGYQVAWDRCSSTPYAFSKARNIVITYDDMILIGIEASNALAVGIGGVGFWDMTSNHHSMLIDCAHKNLAKFDCLVRSDYFL